LLQSKGTTILGDKGFVSHALLTAEKRKQYWVTLQGGKGGWFCESQLTAVDI
jgi:hypothetical protein